MKRILGIILAVLSCAALFALLVCSIVAQGMTLGDSILIVLLSIATTAVLVGLIYLIVWLLN